jgi:hypothetical protein
MGEGKKSPFILPDYSLFMGMAALAKRKGTNRRGGQRVFHSPPLKTYEISDL